MHPRKRDVTGSTTPWCIPRVLTMAFLAIGGASQAHPTRIPHARDRSPKGVTDSAAGCVRLHVTCLFQFFFKVSQLSLVSHPR